MNALWGRLVFGDIETVQDLLNEESIVCPICNLKKGVRKGKKASKYLHAYLNTKWLAVHKETVNRVYLWVVGPGDLIKVFSYNFFFKQWACF